MRHASILTRFASATALGVAVLSAPAAADTLPQIEIEVGRMELVSAPLAGAKLTQITSSNTAVRAYPYRIGQVQIVGDGLGGPFEVDFFDSVHHVQYRQPVWVVESGKLASAGFDQTRVQLPQIVMLPRHSQPVTVPGGGAHQISRVVSSNPGVATARTNTAGTIMVWSVALGDSFVDFTDNATGKRFQVHVWVRNSIDGPVGGSGGGGGAGPRPQPKPIGGGGGGGGGNGGGGGGRGGNAGPVGKFDQCLVGRWRSQSINWNGVGGFHGGDGIVTTIKPDGMITVDYDGMNVIRGALGETNRLSGQAAGRIGIAAGGKVVVMRIDSSNLTHIFALRGQVRTNSLGRSLGYGVPGFHPMAPTYHCTAETVTYSDVVQTYTFEREAR